MKVRELRRYVPVAATIVLMILGGVGGAVWYHEVGYENALRLQAAEGSRDSDLDGSATASRLSDGQVEGIADSAPDQQFSVTPVDNSMSMYENTTLRFAFEFPTQYDTADSCRERTVVTDRSGKEVRLERPVHSSSSGVVETIVLSGQDTYVVAAPNTVLTKGEYRTPEGIGYPTECVAQKTTIDVLEQMARQREYYFFPDYTTWFVYRDVSDRQIDTIMQQVGQHIGARSSFRLESASQERMAVIFSAEESTSPPGGAYGRAVGGWYYPGEKMLAVMASWRGTGPEDTMYLRVNSDEVVTVRDMLESFRAL